MVAPMDSATSETKHLKIGRQLPVQVDGLWYSRWDIAGILELLSSKFGRVTQRPKKTTQPLR